MSESPLTTQQVARVAELSRLKLTDGELTAMTSQLANVLQYIHILGEVNTDGVEPMAHAVETTNVLRDDVPVESLPRSQALANAPKTDGRYFLVPPILDEH